MEIPNLPPSESIPIYSVQKPVLRTETRSYGRITAAADCTARGEVVIDNTVIRIYIIIVHTYIVSIGTCVRGKRKTKLNNNTESILEYLRDWCTGVVFRCCGVTMKSNTRCPVISLVLARPTAKGMPGWVRLRYYIIILSIYR